jgi:hypothetical protein
VCPDGFGQFVVCDEQRAIARYDDAARVRHGISFALAVDVAEAR